MTTAQIGTIDNPFKLTVKQNPYKKDKWDIRVVEAIDKYQAGENGVSVDSSGLGDDEKEADGIKK